MIKILIVCDLQEGLCWELFPLFSFSNGFSIVYNILIQRFVIRLRKYEILFYKFLCFYWKKP